MKVSPINNSNFKSITETRRADALEQTPQHEIPHSHKSVNPVSVTGWVGAASMATAVVSGMMHSPKLHKISAVVGIASIAAHIGLVSARHNFIKSHLDKQG